MVVDATDSARVFGDELLVVQHVDRVGLDAQFRSGFLARDESRHGRLLAPDGQEEGDAFPLEKGAILETGVGSQVEEREHLLGLTAHFVRPVRGLGLVGEPVQINGLEEAALDELAVLEVM